MPQCSTDFSNSQELRTILCNNENSYVTIFQYIIMIYVHV